MIFQWYLFVLLIAVAWFASATRQTYTIEFYGWEETRYKWLPVLLIAVPLIWLAATRADGFGDTAAYRISFRNLPSSLLNISDIINEDTKDPGFTVFSVFLKSIIGNNDVVYFGVIAAICILCIVFTFQKYSNNFIISMFLFIASGDYVQWTHNGIRQFIAVAVIFAATDLLLKKKYVPYILIVLLSYTIHATALLMIPICFIVQGKSWNLRSVLFTIAVLIAINFSGDLSDFIVDFMLDTQYSSEVNQFLATTGTNILRVFVFAIPPVLALIFKRYVEAEKSPILDLSTNMSIVSMGAYIISAVTSGIFVGRIPIYFSLYNYILLPWIVENVFDKRSAKLVYAAIILFYLVFYYYQVEITWGL